VSRRKKELSQKREGALWSFRKKSEGGLLIPLYIVGKKKRLLPFHKGEVTGIFPGENVFLWPTGIRKEGEGATSFPLAVTKNHFSYMDQKKSGKSRILISSIEDAITFPRKESEG